MKFSKKMIAVLLCMLMLLGNFAMVGSAQIESVNSSAKVINDIRNLKDGGKYRLKNVGSGKYLEAGENNVFQNDYDPNNKNQIIVYRNTGNEYSTNIEFETAKGLLGGQYFFSTYNVVPNGYSKWGFGTSNLSFTEGKVQLISWGMYEKYPTGIYRGNYIMTAIGNLNGTEHTITEFEGNIIFKRDTYEIQDYQLWVFEEAQWEEVNDNIVKDWREFSSEEQYRIRNAASGKYLEVGSKNVFQNDLDPNNKNQIFTYQYAFYGRFHLISLNGLYINSFNNNVVPLTQGPGWLVDYTACDGKMRIYDIAARQENSGEHTSLLSVYGYENGFDGDTSLYNGSAVLQECASTGFNQFWYFEKVE